MKQPMEIGYTEKDGLLYPNLTVEETLQEPLGKYGRMRKYFLKEHRGGTYQAMVLSGRLAAYLQEVDRTAGEMLDRIMSKMAENEGVTENLKASDQMAWIRGMESIRNRAEEIVLAEVVYNQTV